MSEQAAPADSQSIEQRIGAWFSDPTQKEIPVGREKKAAPAPEAPTDQAPETTEATSEAPQEPTAPAFEEVEYNGNTYQVPPELKEAIIRQSDYTKKTQDVAEQRKIVEHQQAQLRMAALHQEFEQSVTAEKQQLAMLDYLIQERARVDFATMSTDELLRKRVELDQLKEQKSAVESAIGKKQQDHMAKLQDQYRKIQTDSAAILKQRIPQWSEATAKEVREWALSAGFTNDELSSVNNPLHAEVLWKASQYDKAKNQAKPVVQAKAAKVGASNPMPQETKEYLNFRKAVNKTEEGSRERDKVVKQRIGDIFSKR